jgi:tetratricopeptide (TPR) repeat protein/tRNA A-37 threonylcarbamoyl transferase component Bud32
MADVIERLSAAFASQYTIERELGRGGMATVYLAHDFKHHRRVALKVLRPELTAALGADRFLREIEIAAQFAHPHILPVFDSGEAGGFLYYVMPYVAGESLRGRLVREGQLPIDVAVQIAGEVANALAYAHTHGIVHRDIKPENIMLVEGHAVVADFGIARAISVATGTSTERTTGTGLVLGTPMYMSPEQAAGQLRLDGRADIYSLGCVLYEMVAGNPPFSAATPQGIAARHAYDTPPQLKVVRPGVPPQVEQVVQRSLQKLPADRFASAAEFEMALPRYPTPPEAQEPTVPTRAFRRVRHLSRAGWALIGAFALAAALTATAFHRRSAPALDPSLYMVLPFRHRAEAAPLLLNGDQCESLLHDALGRWHGVQMVDPLWVADARSRRAGSVRVDDGVAIARERRAGRVIMGEVWQFRDTIHVRGLLYDAAGNRLVREQSIRIAPDLSDAQARFQELADSLLIGGGAAGAPPGGGGRLSLPAWRAFQDGFTALQRWDLDSAQTKLKRALSIDPTYGTAQLWLALVLAWAGEKPETWKAYAAGALASTDSLTPRDRALGEAMLALGNQNYPQACDNFRNLIARDSLDFAAWFGLGDCQAKDPLVVRDSKGEWYFRGSYHAAVNAYRRALEIVPSVHLAFRGEAFQRLPDLLYTEPNHIRQGYALTTDTVRFGAFPSMRRDTLEFVPHPLTDVVAAEPGAIPATIGAAVSRNRELLREIATTWVKAFPDRPDAHETLALVLETLGELTAGRSTDYSAMSEIRRARAIRTDRSQSLRLANTETRFLVKSDQVAAARTLADSLLRANPNPTLDDARQLRGLAALTGHVHLAARLQRRAAPDYTFLTSAWEEVTVPLDLTDAALGLFAYASFGVPVDSIRSLEQRVERLIPSYVAPGKRTAAREAMLDNPAVLAFPELGAGPMHRAKAGGDYNLVMQWRLSQGDTTGIRKGFEKLAELQRSLRPGDVAFDGTYHEAWLLLAIGDTAEATHLLDLSLQALPTMRTDLLDQLPQVATLVRGMALRAELAARAGDRATASRWAQDVVVLWSGADPELQPTLSRMQELAQHSK